MATFPFCTGLFVNHDQVGSRKKFQALILVISAGLISVGCSVSHILQFNVLVEKAPFLVVGSYNLSVPDLLIIASPDEIIHPASGIQYPEYMMETFKEVDFNKSFVVLHLVGQIPDNGKITEIVRRGNTVRIKLQSFSVGPGNYMLPDFTLPYQITEIEKNRVSWGNNINFILEVEDGDILTQERHYIP
ncbi:MAG: hypothetical protein IT316_11120 [Anaerolineales bacterium]|nr:hypothetical protein [Anaerolineales bacterium]